MLHGEGGVGEGCGCGGRAALRNADGVVAEGEGGHFLGVRGDGGEHGWEWVGVLLKLGAGHRHGRAGLGAVSLLLLVWVMHENLLLRSAAVVGSHAHQMGGRDIAAVLAALSNVAPGRRHSINIKSRKRTSHPQRPPPHF